MNNALTKWKPLFLTINKYILFQIVEVEWTNSELFKGQLLSSYRTCCSCIFETTMSVYSVREKCESEGALLERAWQTRQSKVKPWTIFLLHAWKSITQTPLVNAREKDPTQRQTSPFPLPPSLLNLPPLHDSVCPYPLYFNFFFLLRSWCLSLLIYCTLQQAGLQNTSDRILGNSCKMIHQLADLYHMHEFLWVHVHM